MKKTILGVILLLSFFLFVGCSDLLTTSTTTSQSTQLIKQSTVQTTTQSTVETSLQTSATTEANGIILNLNPGIDTIEVYEDHIDEGATAVYEIYNLQVTVIENTVNTEIVGIYYIIYQTNYGEKISQIFRAVFVIDSTKPVLTLNPAVDTFVVGDTWTDAGITIIDNYDDDLTYTSTGTVDSDTVGTYIITYIVVDSSGNESSIERYVNIVSNSTP